ncbi:hypothetical protein CSA37_03190 [Candidatus Fermentibacteria bacterium]|nr:MAG: hypothetical protein CSA37_03190 [Candidatus Fermentibacteria bacterium]
MKPKTSFLPATILIAVLLGVVFGILTESRNSILVKEIIYVAGAAVLAAISGVFLLLGSNGYYSRLSMPSLLTAAFLTLYMVFRHFTGIGSVNGPFTILMFFSLAVTVAVAVSFLERKHMMFYLAVLVGSAALIYIYAILQWQGIYIFPWDVWLTRTGRSTGSLGNPNLLGGFASAFLPLGVVRILWFRRGSVLLKRVTAGLFVLLSVLAVVASGTRGSLAGLAVGSVFLAVVYLRSSGSGLFRILIATMVLAAVMVGSAVPMSSRLEELAMSAEDHGTLQVRKTIWSGAVSLFMQNPVAGSGPGSFQILFPQYRNPNYSLLGVSHNTLHVHCEYLEILTDLGLIGLVLWVLLAFFTIRGASGIPGNMINAAAVAGICAMMAEALVSVHLRWPPTAWLFSVFVVVAMVRDADAGRPGRWAKPAAVLLFLASGIFVWGFFVHYIPAAKSSVLVFHGKDIFLSRAENALNSAYAAALNWQNTGEQEQLESAVNAWSYASMCADSSVYYSKLATEVYPNDLGAWYALGSSHLTRYMVLNPPVTAMSNALEHSGMLPDLSAEALEEELKLGIQSYDSLIVKAPNYAEIHNNLALGYSNMGDIDKALDELYRSYRLHGHRRDDYYRQASFIAPLSPQSKSGIYILYQMSIADASHIEQSKTEYGAEEIKNQIAYILSIPGLDHESLKPVLQSINSEYLEGTELEGIINDYTDQFSAESEHPFLLWHNGSIGEAAISEQFRLYNEMAVTSVFSGRFFPSVFPVDPEFYRASAELFISSGFDSEYLPDLLRIFAANTMLEKYLDQIYILSLSDRYADKIDKDVSSRIELLRQACGGSRAAMRTGIEMPWLEGSFAGVLVDTLQRLQRADSLNPDWYSLEMQLEFILIHSYWLEDNLFTTGHNQYLLNRIFFCRNKLREISPNSWQYLCRNIFEGAEQAFLPWIPECHINIQILKDDLLSGVERPPS